MEVALRSLLSRPKAFTMVLSCTRRAVYAGALDYIVAIVEEQNITRAARRLFITQPALTKYINKLEEEYGIILFDRKSSPITLTEAGRVFLEEKTRIEIAEQNLRHRLEALKNGSVTITVGIGHDRAPRWIPKLLQEFCRRYPDINFMIKGRWRAVVAGQAAQR